MISTLPHDRFRNLPEFVMIVVAALLLIFTSGRLISRFALSARAEPTPRAQSERQPLFQQITLAAKSQEQAILRAINLKYSSSPSGREDPASNTLSPTPAQWTELELMVSKQLDISRHRQEVSLRTDLSLPQPEGRQRLSVLPQ